MPTDSQPDALDPRLGFISSPTPFLRRILAHLRTAFASAAFDELVESIGSLHRGYEAELRAAAPGAERARLLHRLMERDGGVPAGVAVSCRKGCSGCCHYEVEITGDEALLLKEVVQGGIEIDRERLARLALRERKSPEWAKLGVPENRCVFLSGEGSCRVYADRPASCRKHMVTSPAPLCTIPGEEVVPVPLLSAEVLMSAALGIEGTECSSLAKMLQSALKEA